MIEKANGQANDCPNRNPPTANLGCRITESEEHDGEADATTLETKPSVTVGLLTRLPQRCVRTALIYKRILRSTLSRLRLQGFVRVRQFYFERVINWRGPLLVHSSPNQPPRFPKLSSRFADPQAFH